MDLEDTYDAAGQLLLKVNTIRGILGTFVLWCCMLT